MTSLIKCPNCHETLEVTLEVSDFDWNSGVSFNGIAEITCPYCHEEMTVEAEAEICDVEVMSDCTVIDTCDSEEDR